MNTMSTASRCLRNSHPVQAQGSHTRFWSPILNATMTSELPMLTCAAAIGIQSLTSKSTCTAGKSKTSIGDNICSPGWLGQSPLSVSRICMLIGWWNGIGGIWRNTSGQYCMHAWMSRSARMCGHPSMAMNGPCPFRRMPTWSDSNWDVKPRSGLCVAGCSVFEASRWARGASAHGGVEDWCPYNQMGILTGSEGGVLF